MGHEGARVIMALGPVMAPAVAAQGSGPSSSLCQPRGTSVALQLAMVWVTITIVSGHRAKKTWSSCMLGRCLQQGRSALVNPNPCLERCSPACLSSGHHRRWHCRRLTANTANHYFENESCYRSGSGPKSQGWLALGSSPGMQRRFHSINKK